MRAKKSLGQNFLKSEVALRKIVETGEIKPDDIILEIGPGKGALTKKLLGSSGQVLAVEKDRELVELLKEKFKKEIEEKKLILLNEDILEFKIASNYKIIANIPYNITGAILKKFLTGKKQPERMVLMVQHEVAKRIMASDKKESILSISVKAYGKPKMIMKVSARYFSPAPKVDSAIIVINDISRKNFLPPSPSQGEGLGVRSMRPGASATPQEGKVDEEKFWEIVKAGFAHKRKKLSSNLKIIFPVQNESLKSMGNKRAEDLSLEGWISLAK